MPGTPALSTSSTTSGRSPPGCGRRSTRLPAIWMSRWRSSCTRRTSCSTQRTSTGSWSSLEPVTVVRQLGALVYQAAAKDVRVNAQHAALYGVLDNRFRRLSPDEPRTNLGGDEWANEWPKDAPWDFVALGKGHH